MNNKLIGVNIHRYQWYIGGTYKHIKAEGRMLPKAEGITGS